MAKSLKIYIGILVLIFIGILILDANRPKPIDWTPTFKVKDKIPFGLYVFDKESENLFENEKITKMGVTPYEFFDEQYNYYDSTYNVSGNFLFIDENFSIDNESVEELFYFADRGNNIFLSSSNFPEILQDSLQFEIDFNYSFRDSISLKVKTDKTYPNYYFNKGINSAYFSSIDTSKTEVLGTQKMISKNKQHLITTNFIRVPYGAGNFYLHTQPIAFTNYYLLKQNYKYAENTLSYLPYTEEIFWKTQRYENDDLNQSPMRFILSQPALKWAWWLFLMGMAIFMFFNAKRRQRVIPIITPLRNTTVDFTKTISNLYYQEGNSMNIIEKKIIFFLEKIRNEYYLDTFNLDETFCNRLHQKSGKSKDEINTLINLIKTLRNQSTATEADVIQLNSLIEKFLE